MFVCVCVYMHNYMYRVYVCVIVCMLVCMNWCFVLFDIDRQTDRWTHSFRWSNHPH